MLQEDPRAQAAWLEYGSQLVGLMQLDAALPSARNLMRAGFMAGWAARDSAGGSDD